MARSGPPRRVPPFLARKKKCQKNSPKNGQIFWPTFLKINPAVFSKKTKKTPEKKRAKKIAKKMAKFFGYKL